MHTVLSNKKTLTELSSLLGISTPMTSRIVCMCLKFCSVRDPADMAGQSKNDISVSGSDNRELS